MKAIDLLREHNIDMAPSNHRHSRRGWVQVDCPFCGPRTRKFHLGHNLTNGKWNCWKCGPKSPVSVLQSLLDLDWGKAKELFGELDRLAFKPIEHRGVLKIPEGVEPLRKAHKKYIAERGFEVEEIVERWDVQGIGPHAPPGLSWRLFLPIKLDGEVVSWTTRAIGKKRLRYRSASEEEESVRHKSILYGEDYCDHAICVHEGPIDAWAIGPGSVATCGTGFTRSQMLRIARYPLRIIAFDNEKTAQRRARNLANDLSVFPGETVIARLSGKDAATSPEHERKEIRRMLK